MQGPFALVNRSFVGFAGPRSGAGSARRRSGLARRLHWERITLMLASALISTGCLVTLYAAFETLR